MAQCPQLQVPLKTTGFHGSLAEGHKGLSHADARDSLGPTIFRVAKGWDFCGLNCYQ